MDYLKLKCRILPWGIQIAAVVIDKMGKSHLSYLKDNNQYYIAGDFQICGLNADKYAFSFKGWL